RGGAPRANQLPTNLIMMKGLDVLGSPTVIATGADPSLRPPRHRDLFQWVREGKLEPVAGVAYPMDAYREALLAKWQSRHVSGAILKP
ncbi:MAG: hypothetical protein AAGA56_31720, partial [Myxococcota bacterium]